MKQSSKLTRKRWRTQKKLQWDMNMQLSNTNDPKHEKMPGFTSTETQNEIPFFFFFLAQHYQQRWKRLARPVFWRRSRHRPWHWNNGFRGQFGPLTVYSFWPWYSAPRKISLELYACAHTHKVIGVLLGIEEEKDPSMGEWLTTKQVDSNCRNLWYIDVKMHQMTPCIVVKKDTLSEKEI